MKKTLLTAAVIAGTVWAVHRMKKNDQSWFWTKEWQDGEREADWEIQLGLTQITTPEGMFAGLPSKAGT